MKAMVYPVYYSNAGVPAIGLLPIWKSLQILATTAAIPPTQYPTIVEVGDGWYSYSITPGSELVGVLDGGVALANADRYKPQRIAVSVATAFGSAQCTIGVKDAVTSVAIPDVEVIVWNSDRSLLVNSGLTNSSGQLVCQLSPGQYVATFRKDGYNFPTPQTVVVTGSTDQSFNYVGTLVGEITSDYRTIVAPFSPSSFCDR